MFLKFTFKSPSTSGHQHIFEGSFLLFKNDVLDKPCDYIVANLTACVD